MKLAINLAKKGQGKTFTNPLVGCVIEHNGKIISKGYHKQFGKSHAEVNALNTAGKKAKNSTMFVTLEPCCHFGKTPPCTKEIIKSKIKKVVIAAKDSDKIVNGKGIKELKKAGIEVIVGVLENEYREINKGYFSLKEHNRPFVTLHSAMTKNGCMTWGNGELKKVTGKDAQKYLHKLRSKHAVILVGINTVLKDNPKLTVRFIKGKNPVRVVLDSNLKFPLNSKMLKQNGRIIIFASKKSSKKRAEKLQEKGVEIILVNSRSGKLNLKEVLTVLSDNGLLSVFVEGGIKVLDSFLKQKLFDKRVLFFAPFKRQGKKSKMVSFKPEKITNQKFLGKDLLIELES